MIRKQTKCRNACLRTRCAISILYDTTATAPLFKVTKKRRSIALRMSFIEFQRNIADVQLRFFSLSLFQILYGWNPRRWGLQLRKLYIIIASHHLWFELCCSLLRFQTMSKLILQALYKRPIPCTGCSAFHIEVSLANPYETLISNPH